MGRGRGRQAILAAAGVLAVGLLGAGCGSESHPNDPRPPLAVEVTINITDHAVQAQPAEVGVKHANTGGLDQNQVREPNADAKAPQWCRIVAQPGSSGLDSGPRWVA